MTDSSSRKLSGESYFVTVYTAPEEGGWIDVASSLPGDAFVLAVDGAHLLARGSFVACDMGVIIDTKWSGLNNLVSGEGGFALRVSGKGQLIVSCYGALDITKLADGESIAVDSGHLVGWDETIGMEVVTAGGKLMQELKSGEELVYGMTGPGRVWRQTRNRMLVPKKR